WGAGARRPRPRSQAPLLRLSLTPFLHVPLEVAAVALELPHVPAPLARVGLQVLPVLADLLPVLRDGVLVARLAILVELPSVLLDVLGRGAPEAQRHQGAADRDCLENLHRRSLPWVQSVLSAGRTPGRIALFTGRAAKTQ